MKDARLPCADQRHLLLPMQPTPNGALHLGHMSGPFLQCDIMARRLRQLGADVTVMCGADVYENWVLLPARESGTAPEDLCKANASQIRADLDHFGIGLDYWANPLLEADRDAYEASHNRLLADAIKAGRIERHVEKVPYSRQTALPVYGVWLQGVCPGCRQPAGGNACENCGYHYQPDEILSPRSRDGETDLDWRKVAAWYTQPLEPESLARDLEFRVPQAEFRKLAQDYAANAKARTRITSPDEWGIPNWIDGCGATICNTFYGYCLYLASVYASLRNRPTPLSHDGIATKVTVFAGIDNLAAALIGPENVASAVPSLRNFDEVRLSRFLLFEGSKFSTSRRHGIWVRDLAGLDHIHPDEVRLYLATVLPTRRETDFDVVALTRFVNRHRSLLRKSLAAISQVADVPAAMPDHEETDPDRLVQDYLTFLEQPVGSASQWLSRFSYLAAPLLPRLSAQIVSNFGFGGNQRLPEPLGVPLDIETISKVAQRNSVPQPIDIS